MEEPGRLQSMGSLRVGRDRATSLSHSGASDPSLPPQYKDGVNKLQEKKAHLLGLWGPWWCKGGPW